MIDVRLDTRKPVHRLVDYLYEQERNHLLSSIDDDELAESLDQGSDLELFNFCVEHNADHIWLDVYMVQQLIKDDDTEMD